MGLRITPQNLLQGQAGVYQVAAQLCLRGMNPYFPAVDNGVDILVDGLVRVQVKSAHLRRDSKVYPQGAYWFKLGRMAIRQRRQVWEQVNFTDFCDFAIFWGIEQNRFWVVPAAMLDGHQLVTLGPDVTYQTLDGPAMQNMHDQGMLQREIGEVLGTSQMTISRRLRGIHTTTSRPLCQQVRACEGRWDLLQGCLDSLREFVKPSEPLSAEVQLKETINA